MGIYRRHESGGASGPSGNFGEEGIASKAECSAGATAEEAAAITSRPVVVGTGEKMLPEADFIVGSGPLPLGIGRNYFSGSIRGGSFGVKWSSNIDYALSFEHGTSICHANLYEATTCNTSTTGLDVLTARRPGGSNIDFVEQPDGTWTYGPNMDYSLEKLADGTWAYWQKDGDITEIYNAGGQPLSVRTKSGSGLDFHYTSGELTSVAHTSGRSMSIGWTNNRITTVTAPNNEVYSYGYGVGGRLASVTYPDGLGTRAYHYEVYGHPNLLTGVSVNGVRKTRYDYDSNNRVIGSGLEGGYDTSTFVYGADRTTVTNALGQSKVYHLDAARRITQIDRPASAACAAGSTSSQYNAEGSVVVEIDGAGNKTTYAYTPLGRIAEKRSGISPSGGTTEQQITTYEWDASELHLLIVKEYGAATSNPIRETAYTYYAAGDTNGRDGLVKTVTVHDHKATSAPSRTTTYDYRFHANGEMQRVTIDGPLAGTSDRLIYDYSSLGDLWKVTNGLGHITTYDLYTGLGQPGRITGPNGLVTELAYDAKGRLTQRTVNAPGGDRITAYAYDAYDHVTSVTDASGRTTQFQYDAAGRMTLEEEPSAHPGLRTQDNRDIRTHYYNDLNQLEARLTKKVWLERVLTGWVGGEPVYEWKTRFTEFGVESWAYDAGGFLTNAYGDNGQNTKFAYNASGDLWKVTDSLNRVTTTLYDTHGRIKSVAAPNGGTALFEYTPLGWLSKVTDREGNVTQYQYNGFGDVVRIISPDAGTTEFGYDAAGRLQTLERADGSVVTYTRDGLGRVLTESATWPPGSGQSGSKVHAYVYDTCTEGKGRLCSATDPTGSTSYTYRTSGELASQTSVIDGATFALAFTYDALGRLSTATYPNGVVLRYAYTAAHRVKQIEAQIGGVWQYVIKNAAWQPFNGPPIGYTYGNGRQRNYSHDLDGRVTQIGTGAGTLSYAYNANDLITAITNSNSAASQTFGYDTMSALTSASSPATGAHSWNYDDNGNRLSHGWGGGSDNYVLTAGTNRLASLVGARPRALTYDANGNLKTETRGGVTVTRKYDGFARLVELARPAAQSLPQPNGSTVNLSAGTWQYGYNALGQRASKVQVGGNLRHRALYSPGSLLLGQTNANSTNLDTIYVWLGREPVGVIRNNQLYAVHADHLGRPEVVTNSASTIVWNANNYAFDRKVILDSFGGLDIGFPGQVYDAEAATWYNVFRDYDASIGRYVHADPIGVLGGVNLYSYVNGNPVSTIDPLGLSACLDFAHELATGAIQNAGFFSSMAYGSSLVSAAIGNDIGSDDYSGFKSELTADGQGSDVYRHVALMAGSMMTRFGSIPFGLKLWGTDMGQAKGGRAESIAELRGDFAGAQVGQLMKERSGVKLKPCEQGAAINRLSSQIASILCEG